jgi:alpha-mannosidase
MRLLRTLVIIPILLLCYCRLSAQPETKIPDPGKYNISHDPVLYTVGYAHLDTQWRWDYPETINQYIKATMEDNFRYFEKYKEYVFTFTGARRYKMMKEYYPDQYEKLKKYISKGRWFVGGSSVDECDANIPSPESILRQVLYGNNYFRSEYGKESVDFLLPDCFGFQAHIPSILAHCGLKGFSTQKVGLGICRRDSFQYWELDRTRW